MKNHLTAFLLLLALSLPFVARAVTVGFEELPRLVKAKNENLLAEEANVRAAKTETRHLTRSFLPRLHAQGGGEIFKTGDFDTMTNPVGGIDVNLNLLNGGKDQLEAKIRQSEHALSQVRYARTYAQELLEARGLFAEVLYQAAEIRNLESALRLNRDTVVSVEKRIQAGLTTKADRLDFEIYSSLLRQELALAREDHEHALEELKVSLGLPLAEPLQIRESLRHAHDKSLHDMPIDPELHPDVQILKKQGHILELKKSQANRWWAPVLDAYASYSLYSFRERNFFPQSERDDTVGGVRLSLNLFDGLESRTQASALKYLAQAQKYQAEHRSREVYTLAQRYRHELKIRHDLVHLVDRSVANSRNYLTLTLSEYETGVKNAPDVLSASQKILDLNRRSAEFRRDYWIIKARLMALKGE